jgi:hypothetical protein
MAAGKTIIHSVIATAARFPTGRPKTVVEGPGGQWPRETRSLVPFFLALSFGTI